MVHVIHVHHTVYIHIVAYVHANIVHIVTHAVWYAYQRFVSAIFAIVDIGNVAIINQRASDTHIQTNNHTQTHTPATKLLQMPDRKIM